MTTPREIPGGGPPVDPVRSRIMAAIRGKDTKPELAVRRYLHAHGLRFSLHRKDLPGRPDIVLRRHKAVVLVQGCFWHGHDCRGGRMPATRAEWWAAKIGRNRERDAANHGRLLALGWRVFEVWECEIRKPGSLEGLVAGIRDGQAGRANR